MPPFKEEEVLTLKQMQCRRTTLYDCCLDLRIEIPRDYSINVASFTKLTLIAIAVEFVIKHKEYRGMIDSIYLILKNTLSVSERHWRAVSENRLYIERKEENAGHILDTSPPKDASAVYDTLEFSGPVNKHCNMADAVVVNCTVKLFLSPGIYGGQEYYNDHNFPIEAQVGESEKIREFIDDWSPGIDNPDREEFDFANIWEYLAAGLLTYQIYHRGLNDPPASDLMSVDWENYKEGEKEEEDRDSLENNGDNETSCKCVTGCFRFCTHIKNYLINLMTSKK